MHLVILSREQEGDSALLCTTTYDQWHSVKDTLDAITNPNTSVADKMHLLPSIVDNANALGYNPELIDNLIQQTAARMLPVYTKMYGDTYGRLQKTLRILRACRLFNYRFIAQTDHLALEEELHQLPTIPKCYQLILALTQELPAYKARADAQVFPSLISQSLIHMHLCSTTKYPSLPSGLCLKRPAQSCGPFGGRHLSNYPTGGSGRRRWHSSRLRPAPLSVFFRCYRKAWTTTNGGRSRITCAAASLCAITVYGWTKITFSYHISILSMH